MFNSKRLRFQFRTGNSTEIKRVARYQTGGPSQRTKPEKPKSAASKTKSGVWRPLESAQTQWALTRISPIRTNIHQDAKREMQELMPVVSH
jgi:hypothetical protein